MLKRQPMLWGVRVLGVVKELPCYWSDQGVYAVMNGGRFWVRHAEDGTPEIDAARPVPLPEAYKAA